MSVKDLSVFSVMGPVMVGPSSSHTAGAVRLAHLARLILGESASQATFYLHGSFDKTGQGHGTHKALVAGLLSFATDDPRVPQAPELAAAAGLEFQFKSIDLGPEAHPNSVRFELVGRGGRKLNLIGASVGGGQVLVSEINGFAVELTGQYATLITRHTDQPGVVAEVTRILAEHEVNIAFLRLSRRGRGQEALMVVEVDHELSEAALAQIKKVKGIQQAVSLPALH